MTSDLWALVAAILLATLQLTISSVLTLRQLGGEWVAGPRDGPREVRGLSGRFVRAHRTGVRPVCWTVAQAGIFLILADLFW